MLVSRSLALLVCLSLAGCTLRVTDTGDTGTSDSGTTTDSGTHHTGGTDTSSTDTSSTDTGSTTDTGATDTGTTDTGTADTGATDTGTTDTGATDTGTTDTGTTDTGDTGDTGIVTPPGLSEAHAAWSMKVDGVTVCSDYTWDLTGTEYTSSDCPDCDFAFLIDAAAGSGNGADLPPNGKCPTDQPFPYGFPNLGGDQTGFAYVATGTLSPYGGNYGSASITSGFFTFVDYNGTIYYPQFHSGSVTLTYYGQTYGPYDYGSGFTQTGTAVSWNNAAETSHSGTYADYRTCSGVSIRDDDSSANGPSDPVTANLSSPDDSASGTVSDCTTSMSDSYTVEVPAGATLVATVDETDSAHRFDPWIWIDDPDGCTVSKGDDEFDCTAGCEFFASCCSGTKVTNAGSSAATYTVYVASTIGYGSCTGGGSGSYVLSVQSDQGTAALTAAADDYYPEISDAFSGSAVVTPTH